MKRLVAFAFATSLLAAPAAAQDDLLSQCTPANLNVTSSPTIPGGVPAEVSEQFGFLCGQVVSAITTMQPSFGIAFSGGAHTLGTATTLGRRLGLFPRISITGRVNGAFADAPNLFDDFAATLDSQGEVPAMGTIGIPLGSVQGDVAVGLLNGMSLGPTFGGVGALDLLGSVSYVPAVSQVGLTEEIINVGGGARLGILKQGLLMPGISVSGMYRTMLSDITFGDLENPDPAGFSTNLSTISLRGAVSKGILMFDLAVGGGYDIYSSDVRFDFALNCPEEQCDPMNSLAGDGVLLTTEDGIAGELSTAAWNVYGNVGMSLVVLNIVGEVGYQKATDVITNADLEDIGDFGDQDITESALDGGRFFASIGLRLTI